MSPSSTSAPRTDPPSHATAATPFPLPRPTRPTSQSKDPPLRPFTDFNNAPIPLSDLRIPLEDAPCITLGLDLQIDLSTGVLANYKQAAAMPLPALTNSKSERAAVQVPALSWTLEDGTVEPRVRLMRPMEHMSLPTAALAESNWAPVDAETFVRLWDREVAEVPAFTTSSFHIITGLLLPVWKRLPTDNPRVYRFVTDQGEHVIGRLVPADIAADLVPGPSMLSPQQAIDALLAGRPVSLVGGQTLRRVSVMHAKRIELTGFAAAEVPGLKAKGLMSEIIAWKLRLFVPTGAEGPRVLARLMAKFPNQTR